MSSTSQTGLVDVEEFIPGWAEEFDKPVVEIRSNRKKKLHRPHPESDEPLPSCRAGHQEQLEWRVVEHAVVAGWRDWCAHDECQAYLEEVTEE